MYLHFCISQLADQIEIKAKVEYNFRENEYAAIQNEIIYLNFFFASIYVILYSHGLVETLLNTYKKSRSNLSTVAKLS